MNKYTLHNFPLFEFTIQLKAMRDGAETGECFDFHNNDTKRAFTLRELCMCIFILCVYDVRAKGYVHHTHTHVYIYNNSNNTERD